MDNTVTYLGWRKSAAGRTAIYNVSRAGWSFQIRVPRAPGGITLTAQHTNGRYFVTQHPSLGDAKNQALRHMHPSEAMAWQQDNVAVGASWRAHWDGLEFRSVLVSGAYTLQCNGHDSGRVYGTLGEVRQDARDLLIHKFGPVPTGADVRPPVEVLAEALVASGADVTPSELTSALAACGLSLA